MADELVNIVNENDEIIRKSWKSICHKYGLLHRVSGNLIFNSEGKLWLQTRKKSKIGGGLIDFSASGHVGLGESYEETAYKELREELGVRTELKLFSSGLIERFDYPNSKIRHIFNLYTGHHDGPFEIQEEELESIDLYDLEEAKKMMEQSYPIITEGLRLGLKEYFKSQK